LLLVKLKAETSGRGELAGSITSQVIDGVCPQLSQFFVADTLNDVDSDTMQLLMDVVNVASSDVNPLNHSTHTHTHPFNGPLSGSTRVSWYQKGKTNLDFPGARDSEWQWHQLGCMQVCTSLQTYNHASTPPLNFLQAGCPSCRPTNSVKALKAQH